jgi:hypothetical protein
MELRSWFLWLDALSSSIALRESTYGFIFLLTLHVVSLCLFAGLVVMMDLRLVGIGNRHAPVAQIQERLFPWQMLGFVVSSVTGCLLFYSQPMRYYGKAFFWAKMAFIGLAGLNALVFHLTTYRSVAVWDAAARPPARAKVAGALGLLLWAGVVAFGRLTAYNWFTFR